MLLFAGEKLRYGNRMILVSSALGGNFVLVGLWGIHSGWILSVPRPILLDGKRGGGNSRRHVNWLPGRQTNQHVDC